MSYSVQRFGNHFQDADNHAAHIRLASNTASFETSSSHDSRVNSWNKFVDADNHKAYLEATSQWNAGTCKANSYEVQYKGVSVAGTVECARQFYSKDDFPRADGLNYTNQSWTAMPTVTAKPHEGADRGRAKVHLCIDIPLRSDPCTDASYSASDSF
ncbi:hypothetical protein GCM10010401_13090 [Rarobacter faecitabidus]|uniref:Uncharacterized protein n=1 Tax=Rarobacter faecitabidus TaxID=13243 RepID=A0A542ZE82_RARFA|nr:hypothetical protein FB461_2060 [Rarobacter faecitabidus]